MRRVGWQRRSKIGGPIAAALVCIVAAAHPCGAKIEFDNESSQTHTVIDIEAGDRTGLLYDIAAHWLQPDWISKQPRITTDARRVRDSFYVQRNKSKIEDNETQTAICERLHEAIRAATDGRNKRRQVMRKTSRYLLAATFVVVLLAGGTSWAISPLLHEWRTAFVRLHDDVRPCVVNIDTTQAATEVGMGEGGYERPVQILLALPNPEGGSAKHAAPETCRDRFRFHLRQGRLYHHQ